MESIVGLDELEEHVVRLFTEEKYSCAESVLLAMARYWGIESPLIPRIATPFRGGLCGTQQVCGAVTGGLMAIGIQMGRDDGAQNSQACVDMGKAFMKAIQGQYGSLACREMTGLDFTDAEQHKQFQAKTRGEICVPLVAVCCRWLADNVKG
jgi:C_GCAxxG_C_C family probable redox protein